MVGGRRAGITAALAIAALAAATAGCGGGTTGAIQLDPVSAAATKTQNAGAARIRFTMAIGGSQLGKTVRMRGSGALHGQSVEMSFKLGSLLGQMGLPAGAGNATAAQLMHASIKEILLEQNGDYVIYMRIPFLASQIPGGKAWMKLDVSKLGKSAGVDMSKVLSGSQFEPTDLLSVLKAEGAKVHTVGPATIDGTATTRYRVTIDPAKALKAKGLTASPLFRGVASKMKSITDNVWIGKDGLVRRTAMSYTVPRVGHMRMAMDLYDYGAHVSIAAPPVSQVFDATQLVQQGIGSTH